MAQAPVLNVVFSKVANDPELKNKIKFVAAAQGEGQSAVEMWKRFERVPFAVVPDSGRQLGAAMNFSSYPVTLLVDKSGTVLWVNVGQITDSDEAFRGIKNAVR